MQKHSIKKGLTLINNYIRNKNRSRRIRFARMMRHGGVRLHGHSRNVVTAADASNDIAYRGRSCHPNVVAFVVGVLKKHKQRIAQAHERALRLAEMNGPSLSI